MKARKLVTATSFCLSMLFALTLQGVVPSFVSSAQGLQTSVPGGQTTTNSPTVPTVDWRSKVDSRVLSVLAVGQAEFLIYMRQQADLSGARALRTKEEKGRYVYERLTATAAATQPNVRRTLEQFGAQYQAFWVSNTISAKGGMAVVQAVASLPEVAAIYPIGKGRLMIPREAGAARSTSSPPIATAPKSVPTTCGL
jgi:hypothetical protein